ncbi:putative amidohydrolase YtcJ [Microbacterium sp. SORGH_AS 1204]|uniref:amidohydrolase family protein n=1 Tax=Microbacterium sp. SORGH_AS_1204 TaxID=3041785 RepID=UPI00278F63AD|nr:amidohydrolase family protein [Microbacterium sp. SORGH_AS_1204]MDQ1136315.1 putative amidohydrolase YtcJ [Microbacterium sp. SORGH_AS_1204]
MTMTVLRGGVVHTLDGSASRSAIAFAGGRVVALGPAAEPLAREGGATVVDLDGAVVVPGVNDAHLHAGWLGARWPHTILPASDTTPSPLSAEPTLQSPAERAAALERTWTILAALGITSYTEPGIGPGEDDGTGAFDTQMLEAYLNLHNRGVRTVRVTLLQLFGRLDGEGTLRALRAGLARALPHTDRSWLNISGVKVFADGIPPLRTACVSHAYDDGTHGSLLTYDDEHERAREDTLAEMIALVHDSGRQLAVHATGDRTIALTAAAAQLNGAARSAPPSYIVHADMAGEDELAAMSAAGLGATIQPLIALRTRAWASEVIGQKRAAAAWPIERILRTLPFATISSDAPVVEPDWRRALDAALTLVGRDDVDLRRLLMRAVTAAPAVQDGAASWKGTLDVGMAADAVVLSADPLEPGTPFPEITVRRTICGGRTVYAAD